MEDDDSGEIRDPRARGFIRLAGLLRPAGAIRPQRSSTKRRRPFLAARTRWWRLKLGRTYLTLEDPDRAIASHCEPARELYAELPGINAAMAQRLAGKGDASQGHSLSGSSDCHSTL